uniref:CULLIN_2 domain-containing protein n=1 Tax=Glossina pallidipes TaxID=7398 RepID=A0A1B0AC92_GLOPL
MDVYVILVLKYVNSKNVLMRYRKVHLTRRLTLGTSSDIEKEEWLREVGIHADYRRFTGRHNVVRIKILNEGAWARCSQRLSVSLALELEVYTPDVEEFYKKKRSDRKLQ